MQRISKVIDVSKKGGRITVDTEGDLCIFDYPEWNEALTHKIRKSLPGASVLFEANPDSISGFIVKIKIRRLDEWIFAVSIRCLMCACVVTVIYFLRVL